jgi:hypothetical protein
MRSHRITIAFGGVVARHPCLQDFNAFWVQCDHVGTTTYGQMAQGVGETQKTRRLR